MTDIKTLENELHSMVVGILLDNVKYDLLNYKKYSTVAYHLEKKYLDLMEKLDLYISLYEKIYPEDVNKGYYGLIGAFKNRNNMSNVKHILSKVTDWSRRDYIENMLIAIDQIKFVPRIWNNFSMLKIYRSIINNHQRILEYETKKEDSVEFVYLVEKITTTILALLYSAVNINDDPYNKKIDITPIIKIYTLNSDVIYTKPDYDVYVLAKYCCKHNLFEVIDKILKSGILLEHYDYTDLIKYTIEYENKEILKLLLEDIGIYKKVEYRIPVDVSCDSPHLDILEIIWYYDNVFDLRGVDSIK